MQHIILVDPDRARLQRIADSNSGVQVVRVHGGGEAVCAGVADADGVLFGLEFRDAAHGAEDLLLHDLHVFADVAEDGRLDEVAFFAVALAAGLDLCAFLFTGVDVAGR